jgi:hypothetical protein
MSRQTARAATLNFCDSFEKKVKESDTRADILNLMDNAFFDAVFPTCYHATVSGNKFVYTNQETV